MKKPLKKVFVKITIVESETADYKKALEQATTRALGAGAQNLVRVRTRRPRIRVPKGIWTTTPTRTIGRRLVRTFTFS